MTIQLDLRLRVEGQRVAGRRIAHAWHVISLPFDTATDAMGVLTDLLDAVPCDIAGVCLDATDHMLTLAAKNVEDNAAVGQALRNAEIALRKAISTAWVSPPSVEEAMQ